MRDLVSTTGIRRTVQQSPIKSQNHEKQCIVILSHNVGLFCYIGVANARNTFILIADFPDFHFRPSSHLLEKIFLDSSPPKSKPQFSFLPSDPLLLVVHICLHICLSSGMWTVGGHCLGFIHICMTSFTKVAWRRDKSTINVC